MHDLHDLGQTCLRAFTRAVPASLTAFYRIDSGLNAYDFQLEGGPYQMHDSYVRRYRHLDPLQPRNCLLTGQEVVPLSTAFAHQPESRNRGYRSFLQRHDVVDVAEVLVRIEGRPALGISLLRQSSYGCFEHRDLATLRSLQEMLQLTVRVGALATTAPTIIAESASPSLTPRERQLAQLLHRGMSNKAMARELSIAPSTVKTHLDNLYSKFNVSNRTELAIRLSSAEIVPASRLP